MYLVIVDNNDYLTTQENSNYYLPSAYKEQARCSHFTSIVSFHGTMKVNPTRTVPIFK